MKSGATRQLKRGASVVSKKENQKRRRPRLDQGTPPAQSGAMRSRFTVEDANRTLPLVRRIVGDAVRDYWRWQDKVRQYEEVAANRVAEVPSEEAERLEQETTQLARDIDGYIAEIRELGVELKGFDTGLVDFPGEMNGKPVLLCWQLGEESVQYWHEEDAGFAGRQPLPSLHGN